MARCASVVLRIHCDLASLALSAYDFTATIAPDRIFPFSLLVNLFMRLVKLIHPLIFRGVGSLHVITIAVVDKSRQPLPFTCVTHTVGASVEDLMDDRLFQTLFGSVRVAQIRIDVDFVDTFRAVLVYGNHKGILTTKLIVFHL